MLVKTDFRFHPIAAAKDVSYEPAAPISARNVQDAIEQSIAVPTVFVPTAVSASPYNVSSGDGYIEVDTTSGPITINMQAGASRVGTYLTIKDVTGHAAANPISVVFSGAETGDGQAPYLIDSNYGAARFSGKAAGGYFVDA